MKAQTEGEGMVFACSLLDYFPSPFFWTNHFKKPISLVLESAALCAAFSKY